MLLKKSVFFLLPFIYSAVAVVEATGQDLLLNKSLEKDKNYYFNNPMSYFTRKIWRRYSDKVNAQTCINLMMTFTPVQPYQEVTVNYQCYCASYFNDQEMAQIIMQNAKDDIEQCGVPKTGYMMYSKDERFGGVAVHCHDGAQAWVHDQFARFQSMVEGSSSGKSWYDSIVSMIT